MDQVRAIERVVLALAVTLLPGLVALGWVPAYAATTAGAVLSSLSAGLRLPSAADRVRRVRKSRRAANGPQEPAQPQDGASLADLLATDPAQLAQLRRMIAETAQQVMAEIRPATPPGDPEHGERPRS